MSKKTKRRSGVARGNLKETKNQKRKRDYADKAKALRSNSVGKRNTSSGKLKLVGVSKHVRPCGNVACKECYASFHLARAAK
jgi:hypothetical protein